MGASLAFYPRALPAALTLGAGVALASAGICLGNSFSGRAPRLRSILLLAFACGLTYGTALRCAEAGGPRLTPPSASAARAGTGAKAGPSSVLSIVGVAGRLGADPAPASGGWTGAILRAARVFLRGSGIEAEVEAGGSLRVFTRGAGGAASARGERAEGLGALLAGDGLELRGRVAAGEGGLALFGDPRDLVALAEAGPARLLRGSLRGGFMAGLRAAAGLPGEDRARRGFGVAQPVTAAWLSPPAEAREAAAGLLVALLTGAREGLDPADAAAFQAAGCAHVLALSGQHLALLASLVALLSGPLVGPRRAKGLALVLAGLFVFVAGAGPSLLRSLVMYAAAAAAYFLDRPAEGRSVLGLSFLIQLALDPAAARGLGFTLSYLAVAGLILLAPVIEGGLVGRLPPAAAAALAATLAAQCATNPLLVAVFGYLQPAGIPATLTTAPFVAVFMTWGLAAGLLCAALPTLGAISAPVTVFLHRRISGLMSWFGAWPRLECGEGLPRAVACLVVVALAAFVYALPHVLERRSRRRFFGAPPHRLRLPHGPARLPGVGGSRHVQALRPELPREPPGQGAHPRRARPRRVAARSG